MIVKGVEGEMLSSLEPYLVVGSESKSVLVR
jgi:hypothetical protein